MQFLTGANAVYIGKVERKNDNGTFYRITAADQAGDVVKLYCTEDVFKKLEGAVFGQTMDIVIDVQEYRNGLNVRCVDVVL